MQTVALMAMQMMAMEMMEMESVLKPSVSTRARSLGGGWCAGGALAVLWLCAQPGCCR